MHHVEPAPSHFVDMLAQIKCPVDDIQIEVITYPGTLWSVHEMNLRTQVYPLLRMMARAKAKKESPAVKAAAQ